MKINESVNVKLLQSSKKHIQFFYEYDKIIDRRVRTIMKLIKKLLAVSMAGLLTFSVSTFTNVQAKSKNDDKTLVVGFDQNFPPFGYVNDDGEFDGFDIELAKEAAKRMDMKIKLQPIDWDSKDMELESGTIDCIWNGFTMNGREDQYTWTDAYMDNSQVFVVRKDSGIKKLKDLKGKTVEVQKESSAESALNDNKKLKKTFGDYLTVADYNTAMMDLESGAVDAIGMDIFVAKDQLKSRDGFKILKQKISSEQYAVGFLKGNTELRDQVQGALEEMVKDGTFAKISKKWFDGQDVCTIEVETE